MDTLSGVSCAVFVIAPLQRTLLALEFGFSTVAMQFISNVKFRKLRDRAKHLHLDALYALYACPTRNPSSLETNQSLQQMAWSINSHQGLNTPMEVPFILMTVIYQIICMDNNRYHG